MAKVISIINHKGGVGKTTITVNLGASLAQKGKTVLLIDFDPQANLTSYLGVEDEDTIASAIFDKRNLPLLEVRDNLFLCPGGIDLVDVESKFSNSINAYHVLKTALVKTQGITFDYVLIDCPPSSLGFFSLNAMNASSDVLIPTEASKLSADGIDSIYRAIEQVREFANPTLNIAGIIISKLENRRLQKDYIDGLRELYGEDLLETNIRSYKHYNESCDMSQTIFEYTGAEKAIEDFEKLTVEIDG